MRKNGIFIRLLAIELLIAGAENFRNTLSLFFVQDYIGADKVGRLYVIYWSGVDRHSLLGLASQKVRKTSVARFCHGIRGIITIACFMLEYGQVTPFYILFALKGFCFGAFAYLPRAMLADVVDLDTVKSGSLAPGELLRHFRVYDQVRSVLRRAIFPFSGLWGIK